MPLLEIAPTKKGCIHHQPGGVNARERGLYAAFINANADYVVTQAHQGS